MTQVAVSSPTRARRLAPSRSAHWLADGAFVVLLAVTIPKYVQRLNAYEFRGDDWRLIQRGNTFGDYFKPYNEHLTAVAIAINRIVLETFGLRSTLPLRVVDVVCLAAAAVAMFLVVRSRVGPALALVAGTTILWYPRVELLPAALNHWLALAAIILCSWALTSERSSADVMLGIGLTFALCSSGVGVAGAVGCLTYVVLSRARLRRWLVVAVPTAAWGVWWLSFSRHAQGRGPRSVTARLDYVRDGLVGSFRGLAAGSRLLAVVLAILFVVNLAYRLRAGLRKTCHELSWSIALIFWWTGLALSRSAFGSGAARYQLVGSAFIILAFLPARRMDSLIRLSNRIEVMTAAVVIAASIVFLNRGDIYALARRFEAQARLVRQQLVAANLGSDVVPDRANLSLPDSGTGFLDNQLPNALVYRHFTAEHGVPEATRTSKPDARIIELGRMHLDVVPDPPQTPCLPLGPALLLPPTSQTLLRADGGEAPVQLRRFGNEWVTIGRVSPGATARIEVPGLQSQIPWMLRAPGACRVRSEPAMSIVSPKAESKLVGTVPLVAVAKNVYVTEVSFRLAGPNNTTLCDAVKSYGWICSFDTTSVPNGDYTLTSVAYDSAGNPDTSESIPVRVAN